VKIKITQSHSIHKLKWEIMWRANIKRNLSVS